MRIVYRQPEDEMPKCEVIFERILRSGICCVFQDGTASSSQMVASGCLFPLSAKGL